ncbi:MAG TPA: hypothetical protein PLL98_10755 [Bacillota bacterium]|nr:hypothetical protein [Bacillota bacterium]
MNLKRNSLIVLIVVIVGIICIFGPKKQEMLGLEQNGAFASLSKYTWNRYNILVFRKSGNVFGMRILDITANELKIIGTMKCKDGIYAAAAFQDGINLYSNTGELISQYKIQDTGGKIISCCISDIDGDSYEELFIIKGNGNAFYGNRLVMLFFDKGLEESYEREFMELNPWKVQTCDVDGDNRKEIALGVYKEAAFHPVMAKRPFLYHWEKDDIAPMWRGSRLSRPFEDYIFFDIDYDGRDEIIAIEMLSDGRALVNAYGWAGFGFESIAESAVYEEILQIIKQNGDKESLLIQVKKDRQYSWAELKISDDKLIENAEYKKIIQIKK